MKHERLKCLQKLAKQCILWPLTFDPAKIPLTYLTMALNLWSLPFGFANSPSTFEEITDIQAFSGRSYNVFISDHYHWAVIVGVLIAASLVFLTAITTYFIWKRWLGGKISVLDKVSCKSNKGNTFR